MGMLSPSAKVVILRARPSGPKSSRILTASRGFLPGAAGKGYSTVSVTQSRPRSSKFDVDRLVNVRLGGDELDFEARRQTQGLLLVGGGARVGGGDVGVGARLSEE